MSLIRLRLLGGVELSAHHDDRDRRLGVAPKPLAMLSYLAVAAADEMPVRRDVLLALFWPELPTDRARGALRQLLFQLRRAVGEDILQTERETIALAPDALSSDVATFEQRLAAGDSAGAMGIYRGPLLDGFFVDGMSMLFEEWLCAARARLSAKAFAACTALADEAERSANGVAASQWARAAAALAPDDEIAVRRLILTLEKFGDRCGALRVADDFTRRLALEFDAAPSAETQTLIAAVRAHRAPRSPEVAELRPQPADLAAPAASVERVGASKSPAQPRAALPSGVAPVLRRAWLAPALVGVVVIIALVATRRGSATPSPDSISSGMTPPITIASPAAKGLYLQGVARYDAGDPREAFRLLSAALAADSDCAMCAYYASMANANLDDTASEQMLARANRLADRVSEPERLLIHYRWADATNSFARGAIADSLVDRYPQWPEAQTAAAEAADINGNWLVAAAHLRRAIAAEPLPTSPPISNAPCPPCATRLLLITTYEAADSLDAALRAAQAFVREQPHGRLAWLQLSHTLASSGRYDEARAAMDSSTRYASGTEDDVAEHAAIEIRARNFETADRLLTTLAQTGNADSRREALWGLIISLRAQGRLREALDVAQGAFRRVNASNVQNIGLARTAEAQIEFELGRYRQAASMFEGTATLSDSFVTAAVGRNARQHVWMLTQAASAIAADGDTVALAALADTVRAWGLKSGFGRDRHLHYYLAGLLWSAREQADSATAAFALATLSETDGFSRLNLERARALIAVGRPQDAIPVLRHSLAGPLEAGNFYATPTEIEEELAKAYEVAGRPDSAAVYYRYVAAAWRGADPQFQPRVARARARILADERRVAARRAAPAIALSRQ